MTEINLTKHKSVLEKARAEAFAAGQEAMRDAAAKAACCGCREGRPLRFFGEGTFGYWTHDAGGEIPDAYVAFSAASRHRCTSVDIRALPIAPAPSPWRPISEAPLDGTLILACDASKPSRVFVVCRRYGEWCAVFASPVTRLTHWMPLPNPPKESGNA